MKTEVRTSFYRGEAKYKVPTTEVFEQSAAPLLSVQQGPRNSGEAEFNLWAATDSSAPPNALPLRTRQAPYSRTTDQDPDLPHLLHPALTRPASSAGEGLSRYRAGLVYPVPQRFRCKFGSDVYYRGARLRENMVNAITPLVLEKIQRCTRSALNNEPHML